jgi:large subunit ribosomal protein L6
MSKIGKNPIALPKGVDVSVSGSTVTVKGSKGELAYEAPASIGVTVEDATVVVARLDEEKHTRALHGTVRALIQNMVTGVSEGYSRKLEIQGVGYRAQLQGNKLVLNIGFCHTVEKEAPEGIEFKVPDPTHIEVSGINKQMVGQTAAEIRAIRKPEPYKGKGIRYEGEQVRRKAGKAGK